MTISIQKQNLQKIQAAVEVGQHKIKAIEHDPDLTLDAKVERVQETRQATLKAVEEIRSDMSKRARAAREGLPLWSQDARRRLAKFADAPAADAQLRLAFYETIKRVPTPALLSHLEDALREGSLAKSEAVRQEFGARTDNATFKENFSTLFAKVVDPQAKAMEEELKAIAGVASLGEVYCNEFLRGRPNHVDRMTAAREAGMTRGAAA